jgi:hypothetical protein
MRPKKPRTTGEGDLFRAVARAVGSNFFSTQEQASGWIMRVHVPATSYLHKINAPLVIHGTMVRA